MLKRKENNQLTSLLFLNIQKLCTKNLKFDNLCYSMDVWLLSQTISSGFKKMALKRQQFAVLQDVKTSIKQFTRFSIKIMENIMKNINGKYGNFLTLPGFTHRHLRESITYLHKNYICAQNNYISAHKNFQYSCCKTFSSSNMIQNLIFRLKTITKWYH